MSIGMVKGTSSLFRHVTFETLNFGARVTSGTQGQFLDSMQHKLTTTIGILESVDGLLQPSEEEKQQVSRYAQQPTNVAEGNILSHHPHQLDSL